MRFEHAAPDSLSPYHRNPRQITKRAVAAVRDSIAAHGFRAPIVVDRDRVIVAGHTRHQAALLLGLESVPVLVADDMTAEQARAYRLSDNRTGEIAQWDDGLLRAELRELGEELAQATGFSDQELDRLLSVLASEMDDSPAPDAPPTDPTTIAGDVWHLGRHRLACADCTTESARDAMGVDQVDAILADPPYCSGGWQEAGRSVGSVGTDTKGGRPEKIVNDTLSTRGLKELIRRTLEVWHAGTAYFFCDWRQWPNVSDVFEASGLGVRNCLAWDKGSPGMGRGWRPQHEFIVVGSRATPKWDNKRGAGNVLAYPRTGNKHHTTEKPVELLAKVLEVTHWAKTIADPFAGSGSTILACEQMGRTCYACEIMPKWADVAIARWEELTGDEAVHAETGETFAGMREDRHG